MVKIFISNKQPAQLSAVIAAAAAAAGVRNTSTVSQ